MKIEKRRRKKKRKERKECEVSGVQAEEVEFGCR